MFNYSFTMFTTKGQRVFEDHSQEVNTTPFNKVNAGTNKLMESRSTKRILIFAVYRP